MDSKNYEIKDFTKIKFEAPVPDLLDSQLSSCVDFFQEDQIFSLFQGSEIQFLIFKNLILIYLN